MIGPDDVAEWLGIVTIDGEYALLERVVGAVEAAAVEWFDVPDPRTEDFDLGLVMQAARIFGRRSSPQGLVSFAELGVIRVNRFDPDIDAMLSSYRKAMVG